MAENTQNDKDSGQDSGQDAGQDAGGREVLRFADADAMTEAAFHFVRDAAAQAIAARGHFTIALSGGSTPRALYQRLAAAKSSVDGDGDGVPDDGIEWEKWWIFWGDERTVPPDHADSNYRMARETLLDALAAPPGLVSSPVGGKAAALSPDEQALAYEGALQENFGESKPRFDLILLGMGTDGHTASLFPHTKAVQETFRLFVANDVPQLETKRLTFTFPLINAARRALFLVTSAGKEDVLREVLEGARDVDRLPSQGVQLTDGVVTWMISE